MSPIFCSLKTIFILFNIFRNIYAWCLLWIYKRLENSSIKTGRFRLRMGNMESILRETLSMDYCSPGSIGNYPYGSLKGKKTELAVDLKIT